MLPSANVRLEGGGTTASDTQQIRLVNPHNAGNWIVRTNNWVYTNTSLGHGSVSKRCGHQCATLNRQEQTTGRPGCFWVKKCSTDVDR
jgi:hypothetical protein